MKKTVGIYRLNFPEVSETFIRAQLGAYRSYRPMVYAKKALAQSPWPINAVSAHGSWAERKFLLTRSPRWHRSEQDTPPQLLHAHFGVDGVYALPLATGLGIPLVTTFHGFDVLTKRSWWLRHPSLPVAVYLAHLKELRSSGARFIAVSRFVEQALIDAGFPLDRIVQHYIGVDTKKFQPNPGRRDPGSRYVLSVGRHVGFKGVDVLLKAFARIMPRHPDVHLLQVGAGPLTPSLKALAQELGLSARVTFLGAQPNERVVQLLQGAEVFALPSRTHASGSTEALGIVFNEASACAVPIASTRSGGIPEVVLDGETGLLCGEGDDAALAVNLDAILSDKSLGERFGRRGRELVCDSFDLQRQTEKLEQIYDEVIA